MKNLYTAHAISIGGRSGHVETDDKRLTVDRKRPAGPM
jgi:organic hydroperoxide reductase OsmC/OhrA